MGACCSTQHKYDTATVVPTSCDDDDEAYLDSVNGDILGPAKTMDSTRHSDRVHDLIDASRDSKASKSSDQEGKGSKLPHKSRKGFKGDRGKISGDSGGSLAERSSSRILKDKSRSKESKKGLNGKSRRKVHKDLVIEEMDAEYEIVQRQRSHSFSGQKNRVGISGAKWSLRSQSFREPKKSMVDTTVDSENVSQLVGGSTHSGEEDVHRGVVHRLSKTWSADLPQQDGQTEDMLDNGLQSKTRVVHKPSRRDNTEIKAELDKLKALRVMKALGGGGPTNEKIAASKWKTLKHIRKKENTQDPLYAGKADGAAVKSADTARSVKLQGWSRERQLSRKLLSDLADALDAESDVLSKKTIDIASNSRLQLVERSKGEVATSSPSASLAASTTRRNSLLSQGSRGGLARDNLPPDLRATLTEGNSGNGKLTRAEIARKTKQALTGVSQRRIL